MKSDLCEKNYCKDSQIKEYIYGSAEVVGLMCLKIFTDGNNEAFENLRSPAMKLGSAFQKVNFLRDLRGDLEDLGRNYFPVLDVKEFNDSVKKEIINDIKNDFEVSYTGIRKLPPKARLPVLTAYYYYLQLLKKVEATPAGEIINSRIRINNFMKALLFLKAFFVCRLRLI
jgi:phytoene/squalene synthetase